MGTNSDMALVYMVLFFFFPFDNICIMVSKQFEYGMLHIIERCEMGMQWYQHISYGLWYQHVYINNHGINNAHWWCSFYMTINMITSKNWNPNKTETCSVTLNPNKNKTCWRHSTISSIGFPNKATTISTNF